jgi:hypothetical protein
MNSKEASNVQRKGGHPPSTSSGHYPLTYLTSNTDPNTTKGGGTPPPSAPDSRLLRHARGHGVGILPPLTQGVGLVSRQHRSSPEERIHHVPPQVDIIRLEDLLVPRCKYVPYYPKAAKSKDAMQVHFNSWPCYCLLWEGIMTSCPIIKM